MERAIRFFEVGPRDGLQNEKTIVPVDRRIELIEGLVAAGARDVEIGSFVHPKWVPQMAGTDEVARSITRDPEVRYWALVPNRKGLERALACDITYIAVFMSATEAHNRSNLNRSLRDSLDSLEETISLAGEERLTTRAYISTAFGCPYEGEVDFDEVLRIGDFLLQAGADHICLGDTIGAGSPQAIGEGCGRAVERFGVEKVALHLHDTQGLALPNALIAYQQGVRLFDGAVGGMGGCPYAPGAAGNVASDDLVNMFTQLDIDTGYDLEKLVGVTDWLGDRFGFKIQARYYNYWRAGKRAPGV